MKLTTRKHFLAVLCSAFTLLLLAGCNYDADAQSLMIDGEELHQFAIDFNKAHHDDSNEEYFAALGEELVAAYGEDVADYSNALAEEATNQAIVYGNAVVEQATEAVNAKIGEVSDTVTAYGNAAVEFGSAFVNEDGTLDVEKTTEYINDTTDALTTYGNAVVEDLHEKASDFSKQVDAYGEAFMEENSATIDAYSDTIDAMLNEEGDGIDINNAYGILGLDKEGSQAVADSVLGYIGAQKSSYYIDQANSFVNAYSGNAIKQYTSIFGKKVAPSKDAEETAKKLVKKDKKASEIISDYGKNLANEVNDIIDSGYYSNIASSIINQTGDGIKSSNDYIAMSAELINEYGNGFDADYYQNIANDVINQINSDFLNSGSINITFEF